MTVTTNSHSAHETMRLRPIPRIRFVFLVTTAALVFCPMAMAKKRTIQPKANDASYAAALAVANRFLTAWQNNDQSAAMPLITNHAKQLATEDGIDKLFSGPTDRAFEIPHGKSAPTGRYAFSAVLLQTDTEGHLHRRFANLVIIHTGKNDWAVDKLP